MVLHVFGSLRVVVGALVVVDVVVGASVVGGLVDMPLKNNTS